MLYKSKLKGSFGRIYPITLIIVYMLCAIEALIRWQFFKGGMDIPILPVFTVLAMSLFFLVMGIIQYYKYRLWIYPVLGIFVGLGCVLAIFFFTASEDMFKVAYVVNILVIILLVVVFWSSLSAQEKYEANARRLFKLAAEQLEDTAEGYTGRPFSAGKINVEPVELEGFLRFLNGKFITRTFRRGNDFYLSFSMNRSVLTITEPAETSNICINSTGEIAVQVSQADYRQYRERFSFDQLCASMGGLFARFLEYYREGMENRIITELRTAR